MADRLVNALEMWIKGGGDMKKAVDILEQGCSTKEQTTKCEQKQSKLYCICIFNISS